MTVVVQPIRSQIDALLHQPFTGSCFKPLVLKDPASSAPAVNSKIKYYDHFKLLIPYAGYTLAWEIRFDGSCPEFAPDFLFDDELFLSYFDIDKLSDHVPSLVNWDARRPECLREVVQQLLNLYTTYQIQRMESPLGMECDNCMQEFDMDLSQVQILPGDSPVSSYFLAWSTRPAHNTTSVMFLNLEKNVSSSEIPVELQKMALQFLFRDYGVCVSYHASPGLKHLLGDQDELEIQNYSKNDGLVKYVHHFLQITKETLSQVIESCHKREMFHIGLYFQLTRFEDVSVTPVENDMPHFTLNSFIVEAQNFSVLVIVKTPSNGFGDPKVSVRTSSGTVYDIPLSPAWDYEKAAQLVFQALLDFREKNGNEI